MSRNDYHVISAWRVLSCNLRKRKTSCSSDAKLLMCWAERCRIKSSWPNLKICVCALFHTLCFLQVSLAVKQRLSEIFLYQSLRKFFFFIKSETHTLIIENPGITGLCGRKLLYKKWKSVRSEVKWEWQEWRWITVWTNLKLKQSVLFTFGLYGFLFKSKNYCMLQITSNHNNDVCV